MTRLLLVLSMTAAVTVAGLLMWKAEATPLTGALDTHAVTTLFCGSKGLVHVRHTPLRRRYQMVLHQNSWCCRTQQEVRVPALLIGDLR